MVTAIFSTLPMFACSFWAVVLLLDFKQNDRAKRFLTFFMIVAAVLYLCHSAYFNKEYNIYAIADSIYTFATLSVYPLYYLYIRLLTEERALSRKDFIILLPAIVLGIATSLIYSLMPADVRMQYILHWVFGNDAWDGASTLIKAQLIRSKLTGLTLAFQIVPVLYLGGKKISSYNKEINNYYSDTEGKTFSQITLLLSIFVATSLFSFLANIIGKDFFATAPFLILIPSILFGTLLFSLGYFGNKQQFTAADFQKERTKADALQNGVVLREPVAKSGLAVAIIRLLEEEELFRQPDLKLPDLARLLGSNRTYVYETINKEMNQTFSELINKYRVEYAKKLLLKALKANETLNLSVVIEESGFSAESSFYRIFKSVTGTSPKEWAKKQEQQRM